MSAELLMVYHENGGNESFEVKGNKMLALKYSDSHQSYNFVLVKRDMDAGHGRKAAAFGVDSLNQAVAESVSTTVLRPNGGDSFAKVLILKSKG